jgi:hypothetical protein
MGKLFKVRLIKGMKTLGSSSTPELCILWVAVFLRGNFTHRLAKDYRLTIFSHSA